MDATQLAAERCVPCEGIGEHFDEQQASRYAELVPGWTRDGTGSISRHFRFANYRDAFGFATRLSLLAEDHGHHPDLEIGWGRCVVTFTTHAVGGLTINDFVLAANADRLAAGSGLRDG